MAQLTASEILVAHAVINALFDLSADLTQVIYNLAYLSNWPVTCMYCVQAVITVYRHSCAYFLYH